MEQNINSGPEYPLWDTLPDKSEIRVQQSQTGGLQERVNKLLGDKYTRKYTIIVFKSSSTQVIHARGGVIYIPEGLLKLAKNDTEILFMIEHEVAHWENGDISGDKVQIPISKGYVRDRECLADQTATESVVQKLGENVRKKIKIFLKRLEKKYGREMCEQE